MLERQFVRQSAAKRPVKAAGRKTAAAKSPSKAVRSARAAKARASVRARSKEVEAKLRSKQSRSAQESPTSARQGGDARGRGKVEFSRRRS